MRGNRFIQFSHAGRVSLDSIGYDIAGFGDGLVGLDHHDGRFERGVGMDGVPLDAITDKIVIMRPLVIIDSVQMGLEAAAEPPGAVVVLGAVVIETVVIVLVLGAEGHAVMALPL